MKRELVAVLGSLALAAPAGAAVITLEEIVDTGGQFRFDYQATLGPDEGMSSGSRLIIYDFGGYVDGSVFAPAGFAATTELASSAPFMIPGQTDDPTLANLVFTYTGADFRTTDGPFAPFDFEDFGALSIYNQVRQDAFATWTIKNNPEPVENTLLIQVGTTLVPQVPEPAAWALMIGGFGLVGAAMRRQRPRRIAAV